MAGAAQRLSRLQIDHQVKPARHLDRQVRGLGTLQDQIDISRDTAENPRIAGPEGRKRALFHHLLSSGNAWELFPDCDLHQALALRRGKRVGGAHADRADPGGRIRGAKPMTVFSAAFSAVATF